MSPAGPPLLPEAFTRLLEPAAARFGRSLSPTAISDLSVYLAELDRWRRRINLAGALSGEDLVAHAMESTVGETLIPHGTRVIDIGSGGGFPALPLAILRPDLDVTMIEPRGKRAAFLRHVSRLLHLDRAEVLESSIEALKTPGWSVATTRALGDLGRLVGRGSFLQASGLLLAWTTEPKTVAAALEPDFLLESVTPLEGADRRVIAAYRKR
jgi:16S rRNA (guanine527-N7)-methyltransferase